MLTKRPFLVIEPRHSWWELHLSELWRYRDLFLILAWRDIAVHYKQTFFGAAWAVIQPLAGMVIFTIVFSRIAKLPTENLPAPVFYYAGLLAWTFFSQAMNGASQSLIEGSRLITKVYFPRIMIPASALGYTTLNFLVAFLLFIPLMAWYGVMPTVRLAFLPLWILALAATSLGVGVTIAALNVKYRDFRYVVPFLLQVWMFATPLVFPVSMIPEKWRWLAAINPMTGLVDGFRASLTGLPIDLSTTAISVAIGSLGCVAGIAYFRVVEDEMADIL